VTRDDAGEIRSGGMWGSALTCGEFAAIRGAGFEPVGQVFGAAVYGAGAASWSSCPGTGGSAGFGPLAQAMDQARHTAIGRMMTECGQLGGHGVVGVRLDREPFPLGGLQFTAIGTAVRAPGAAYRAREPFTCDLSGQDFAKLIMAGWVPVGLALGISIRSRHDDRVTARQARWGTGNAEVAGWTELVTRSRHEARRQLDSDVKRLGGEGAVIAAMELRVSQRDCPAAVGRRDHIVEATLIGTGIVRFSGAGRRQAGPALSVMPLGPRSGLSAKSGFRSSYRRVRLTAARLRLASRRRSLAARPGRVGTRGRGGGATASRSRPASRARAACRFACWLRCSEAATVSTPPASRPARRSTALARAHSGSAEECSTSKESSTRLSVVLTDCPPGPDE
jgi:uncharacterized protein YbjQ (UPF0145 family)